MKHLRIMIVLRELFNRANWRLPCRAQTGMMGITRGERMLIALLSIIGSMVTFLSLGCITFIGDLVCGIQFGAKRDTD